MNCVFDPSEPGIYVCRHCGWITTHARAKPPIRNCPESSQLPGYQLRKLLSEFGIRPRAGCPCNERAKEMDAWGVSGCRERREEIADWLLEAMNLPDDGTEDESNVSGRLLKMLGRHSPRWVQRRAALWLVDEAIARAETAPVACPAAEIVYQ